MYQKLEYKNAKINKHKNENNWNKNYTIVSLGCVFVGPLMSDIVMMQKLGNILGANSFLVTAPN